MIQAQTLTVVGKEGSSTVDVTGDSAAKIAEAVNTKSGETGVTATAKTTATLSGLSADGSVTLNLQGTNTTAIGITATVLSSGPEQLGLGHQRAGRQYRYHRHPER